MLKQKNKTKSKVSSLNFIIHRQKRGLSVYWNMRSSLSTPIKKERNIVICLHIQKIYDWWPMRSQNSAKHLWLSAHIGPTFKKHFYHWLFTRSHFSTRIFTTDGPLRMDIQREYRWLTTQGDQCPARTLISDYVGSLFSMNTHDWLSIWNLCSTWALTTDWPCQCSTRTPTTDCPPGSNVQQEKVRKHDIYSYHVVSWMVSVNTSMYLKKQNINIILYIEECVFWDAAPCRSCVNRHFGGTYCLHLRGRKILSYWSHTCGFSTLKMEAKRFSETSVHTISTWCHIPEDGINT
jgi:hypothetical protein